MSVFPSKPKNVKNSSTQLFRILCYIKYENDKKVVEPIGIEPTTSTMPL